MEGEVAIGKIRKPHGVKGCLKILSFSGDFNHFFGLTEVTLKGKGIARKFRVEKVTPLGEEVLLKLVGLDNPEAGKFLNGWDIWVPRSQGSTLGEGEFYHADLVGCRLFLGDQEVGVIRAIIEAGADDLLEVQTPGGDRLVPFNSLFIGDIRMDEKEIELLEGWVLE